MRISDDKRVLFVHVPKTGGVTVENVLRDNVDDLRWERGTRHRTLKTILEEEPALSGYWIFGFVRNPWARMVSWWSMIGRARARAEAGKKSLVQRRGDHTLWKAVRDYRDFETFVLRGTDDVPRLRRPQISYLDVGTRRADFIGRTESLADDLNVVRAHLGAGVMDVPHLNQSEHTHYSEYYTAASRDRVAAVYRRDIEEFGYEF